MDDTSANLKLALALLASIVIGAAGMKAMYAQASMPPGYFIAEITMLRSGCGGPQVYRREHSTLKKAVTHPPAEPGA